MSEKKFYVYVHRYASGPKEGQVFYVGKGCGNRAFYKWGRSEIWSRHCDKYGFTAEIIIRFKNEACAFSFERALIRFYGRKNLVNLTDGGDGSLGLEFCHETMAPRHGENAFWYGKTGYMHPMFGKKGLLNPMFGRKHTEETLEKISGSQNHMFGKTGSAHHFFGSKHSEKTIEKLRKATIKNKLAKPVKSCSGMMFKSAKDAVRWLMSNGYPKAAHQNISSCANGKYKSAYGFKWEFV